MANQLIYLVAGARPNFMKIAPLIKEFEKQDIQYKLVHTGQHYDYEMSKIFFDDLGIPEPDFYLGVGSASHAVQTAKIMIEFEKILLENTPDLVIVVGDVNSTIACALVAKKLFVNVAHVEAGLRSFDRRMPEEINRILTDQISDLLFITEKSAVANLMNEGIESDKIHFVGNVMIDTLVSNLEKTHNLDIPKKFEIKPKKYALVTIHRPSNVDKKRDLRNIIEILNTIQKKIKIIFPIHPRTSESLKKHNLFEQLVQENLILTEPIGYLQFLNLMKNTKMILTDSGGIQEEASFLKIPIITLRENTERPITVDKGTNVLVGTDKKKIERIVDQILSASFKKGQDIEKWDGKTSQRIVEIVKDYLNM
ncbi:MAG: UDP-N-acetylglucosamine 2-epimerase (non-hydrolyzing) [Candidatus Lokiarchaeota archaeon]|nr:UDP-N-acetylglucosamine 2-epimerase (non-hydrolyzing) [Candidatus Lokiarchaeota archaeon]